MPSPTVTDRLSRCANTPVLQKENRRLEMIPHFLRARVRPFVTALWTKGPTKPEDRYQRVMLAALLVTLMLVAAFSLGIGLLLLMTTLPF
jgi:hypothetical protein